MQGGTAISPLSQSGQGLFDFRYDPGQSINARWYHAEASLPFRGRDFFLDHLLMVSDKPEWYRAQAPPMRVFSSEALFYEEGDRIRHLLPNFLNNT